jgi:hypothetical protein
MTADQLCKKSFVQEPKRKLAAHASITRHHVALPSERSSPLRAEKDEQHGPYHHRRAKDADAGDH